jgi:hypothetical protein
VRDVKQELGLIEDVTPVEVVEDEDELGQYVAERAKQLQAGDSDESK